jgi:hypothetical protein
MRHVLKSRTLAVLALVAAALLVRPTIATAQVAGGEAKAVQATMLGLIGSTTTVLAGTGVLAAGSSGALDASSVTGSVPSLLAGDSLHGVTIGSPDEAFSEASLGSLGIALPGVTIAADFVMAQARAMAGGLGSGTSEIAGLAINGVAVPVSGAPNQAIPIPGGQMVLNEQQTGAAGARVNAIHVVMGVADLVVASVTAATP